MTIDKYLNMRKEGVPNQSLPHWYYGAQKNTVSIRLVFLAAKNSQFFRNFIFLTNTYPGCVVRMINLPLILNCCFLKIRAEMGKF